MGCCEISSSDNKQTFFLKELKDIKLIKETSSPREEQIQQQREKQIQQQMQIRNHRNINQKNISATEVYEDETLHNDTLQKIFARHRFKDSKMNSNISNQSQNRSLEIPKMRELKLPNTQVLDSVINSRKKLILKVIEGKYLEVGTELIVNAGGLEGSERMAKDGVVIFGNKPVKKSSLMNDFNFPKEETIGEKHFQVKYDIARDEYFAKDLYGSGLFTKIKVPYLLKNNSIFSFVTSHILVRIPVELNEGYFNNNNNNSNNNGLNNSTTGTNNFNLTDRFEKCSREEIIETLKTNSNNENNNNKNNDIITNNNSISHINKSPINSNSKIIFKVIYGINKGEEYSFDSSKVTQITFGRQNSSAENHIKFAADSISRIQCTVFYQDNNWYVIDSNGELTSMNGTWCLVDEFMLLEEDTVLKAGTTSFECHFKSPENKNISNEDNEYIGEY